MIPYVFAVLAVSAQSADLPFVSPAFGDHMVLQRDLPSPIWGWTTPGSEVRITIGSTTVTATASADGKWLARLPRTKAGGPHRITITGKEQVVLDDVLFGDVWICSGQSNMEQGIGVSKNPTAEIADANHPNIRLFMTQKKFSLVPIPTPTGSWSVCSPESIAKDGWGGFSAVAYYFGRKIHQETGVPVGLIQTCWGGTVAEAWTSEEALGALPDFASRLQMVRVLREGRDQTMAKFQKAFDDYVGKIDQGEKEGWHRPSSLQDGWQKVAQPDFESNGRSNWDGIGWFQAEFDVPASLAGKAGRLLLGPIDDQDTAWVNGQKVGANYRYDVARNYELPSGLLKAGMNTVIVRVLDTGGEGGLRGSLETMKCVIDETSLSLAGWRANFGASHDSNVVLPVSGTEDQNTSTALYNAMIHPWLPYGIKGAIWYQGESNAGRSFQYRQLLATMIGDWRNRWGVGDFPFLIVQLANYMQRNVAPVEDGWAELREAQNIAAKKAGKAAVAVIIDAGDANDIHPKDKQTVGHRLGLAAMQIAYGKKGDFLSPLYHSMQVSGNRIRARFDNAAKGLLGRNGDLRGFAIAGSDRKFVWARAQVVGRDTVEVWSPSVATPVAVRYAWSANPLCNLYNSAGLPASPFRTDDWPMLTQNAK